MVDFVAALQAVSAGLTALKELQAVEKEYDKATLKLKIAELSSALATAQITLADAQSDAAKKDAEINKLKGDFKRKDEGLIEYHGYFYRKGADGKPEGRPHCARCLDKGTIMMMTPIEKAGRPLQCPECKSEYQHLASFGFKE